MKPTMLGEDGGSEGGVGGEGEDDGGGASGESVDVASAVA